jgi:4'-phosphopantetheinyl transferase
MPQQGQMGLSAAGVWLEAPRSAQLPEAELHIWQADVKAFAAHERALTHLLTATELERADSFRQRPDRARSILARAALRDILGRYLDTDPRSLQLSVSGGGKPVLDPAAYAGAPQFSVSHSGDIVLLAFARGHEVGVDVEAIRSDLDMMEIAQRFFAPAEVAELLGLPADRRVKAFFDGWTRKEAYLKARAEGIGAGLNRFAVTLAPDAPARLISDDRNPEQVASWRLYEIPLGPGYAAATAIRNDGWSMRCWKWEACLDDAIAPAPSATP